MSQSTRGRPTATVGREESTLPVMDSSTCWNKMKGLLLILIQCVPKLLHVFNCFISMSSGISVLPLNSTLTEFDEILSFLAHR